LSTWHVMNESAYEIPLYIKSIQKIHVDS
jgi:hypothetical protein